MSFTKFHPRAKVSRHATLDGWVIDIIQREGAKPKRVGATYASIPWAVRAARVKLGLPPVPEPTTGAPTAPHAPAGICGDCNRPMRPAGSKAADYPRTTLRQREGLCQSCNARNIREGAAA